MMITLCDEGNSEFPSSFDVDQMWNNKENSHVSEFLRRLTSVRRQMTKWTQEFPSSRRVIIVTEQQASAPHRYL